jgi:hypothetical protein
MSRQMTDLKVKTKCVKSMMKNDIGIIKKVIPTQMCSVFTQYALFGMFKDNNPGDFSSAAPGVHCKYSDPLAESLLLQLSSVLNKTIRNQLIPTHSYLRVYKSGDYLKESIDTNPACEISFNIYLGSNYDMHVRKPWPLHVIDEHGNHTSHGCGVGDAVCYFGTEHKTYRDPLDFGDDLYHVELVLHYVDAAGPYAEEYKYNKRSFVGT